MRTKLENHSAHRSSWLFQGSAGIQLPRSQWGGAFLLPLQHIQIAIEPIFFGPDCVLKIHRLLVSNRAVWDASSHLLALNLNEYAGTAAIPSAVRERIALVDFHCSCMHDKYFFQFNNGSRATMHVQQDRDAGFKKARLHPFISSRPGEAGFVDFKHHPELITEVLEDFVAFGNESAIKKFYSFLAWLNGPDSVLESCDCALRGPESHNFKYSQRSLSIHGRLMLMYRDLSANCDDRFNLLYNTLGRELSSIDQELSPSQGSVGIAGSRALFKDLFPTQARSDGHLYSRFGDPGRGYQVLLLFKAFGDDEDEAFLNLNRVFKNIELACRRVSEKFNSPGQDE